MAQPDGRASELAFLRGGGATGELIAKLDWSSSPLGPPSTWPPTLKTTTAIVLRSPIPMALLWGQDGVIIYNDPCAEIAGDRHPQVLGAKVREAWPDIADFDDRVIKAVLRGEALEFRDQVLTLNRSGRPEQLWFDLDYSPVSDESGQVVGVLAVVVETTARVLAERKAVAHAERLQRLFEQAPGYIALLSGPDHKFEFRNEAHKRAFGQGDTITTAPQEVLADFASVRKMLDHAYATGERYSARAMPIEVRRRPDGPMEKVFVDFVLEPVTDDAGQVSGIFIEGFDVTEHVRAQTAVEENQYRLSAALAVARLGVFENNLETQDVTLDARAREIHGFEPDAKLTAGDLFARLDDRDAERVRTEISEALMTGRRRQQYEYRIRLPDGSIRDIVNMSDSLPEPDGRIRRVIGVFDDVTERRRAEQRQLLLINELNHRVKNTLAIVQSIAAQTLRSAPDVTSARNAFEARLLALAAAHDLLTAESWRGARLTDVAASAMAPFEITHRPQISRSGPPVWLTAPRALALSLALHELATNAAKYGALSHPEGRVLIRWKVVDGGNLLLSWIEEGGPPVTPPTRAGFGTRLLQRNLIHELQGETAVTYAPEGVRCEIRFRIEDPSLTATSESVEF